MREGLRDGLVVWASSCVIGLVVFAACGGGGTTTRAPVRKDFDAQAADFRNIATMTRVGNHFVDNRLGYLAEALAVARSPRGGRYPLGTIIQLVPQEAMVKREKGWSQATNDWEFFSLSVSRQGTTILTRGKDNVVNRFGGNCASCHSAAGRQWDFVCEKDHGCAPLPIGDPVIAAIQHADPRPR